MVGDAQLSFQVDAIKFSLKRAQSGYGFDCNQHIEGNVGEKSDNFYVCDLYYEWWSIW